MTGDSDDEAALAEAEDVASQSMKTAVIAHLARQFDDPVRQIVYGDDVVKAIRATGADQPVGRRKGLQTRNTANFLKDIVRNRRANEWWPRDLKDRRITARQRYGKSRVMQFIPYADDQNVPFPDRYDPTEATPRHKMQSASMPFLARTLGREEETWLTQVVVNLRIIETELALFSPLSPRLRDITHLQMGMKTQPEIDATFVLTLGPDDETPEGPEENLLVTCEAKQKNERLLEDQIREQVAKAFDTTEHLTAPPIHGVKPFAVQVLRGWEGSEDAQDALVYVAEFKHIPRHDFEREWRNIKGDARKNIEEDLERIYEIPLVQIGGALFQLRPRVRGINLPMARPSATKARTAVAKKKK